MTLRTAERDLKTGKAAAACCVYEESGQGSFEEGAWRDRGRAVSRTRAQAMRGGQAQRHSSRFCVSTLVFVDRNIGVPSRWQCLDVLDQRGRRVIRFDNGRDRKWTNRSVRDSVSQCDVKLSPSHVTIVYGGTHHLSINLGVWRSGSASALHAEGLGFDPLVVHIFCCVSRSSLPNRNVLLSFF